jgi:uncharacterized protein
VVSHVIRTFVAVCALLLCPVWVHGETVEGLPTPTNYVSDFAGVLSQETTQLVDALCHSLDQQAHAQIAVVTIKTIDPDKSGATPSIEDFAVKLEEKWKVGTKGTDRGVLMLLVMNPRRGRIEVGYGLEGVVTDARSGDIGREMSPYAQKSDYDDAVKLGVKDLAGLIATDAGVNLDTASGAHQYHWQQQQQAQPVQVSLGKMILIGGGVLLVLILLAATGNLGLVFWFLLSMIGGGGGGGGWRGGGGGGGRDDGDGGFGGFGGGRSGGGGASGDF